MADENILPETNESADQEPAAETPESPRRRITRRKLRPKKPTLPLARPTRTIEQKEIDDVLTNLYHGDDTDDSPVQEITMKKSNAFFKTTILLGFGVLVAGVIWAGFFYAPSSKGNDAQVNLGITGPTELQLGTTTTYTISFANNSSVPLRNVVLNAYFPEGFVYQNSLPSPRNTGHNEWNLNSLAPYQKGSISITGLMYGSLGDQKSWRVFLNYLPTNFNSELQKAATLTTSINSSPVKLSITGPDQVAVGTNASYTFTVQDDNSWSGPLAVSPQLPANFTLVSSTPTLNKNNQWPIPASSTTSSLSFTIVGKFTSDNQNSPIKGMVLMPTAGTQNYQIASAQLTSALLRNDVSVDLAINGAVTDFDSKPGDMLNITVRVKNMSANEITNASVKLALTAPSDHKVSLLDWANLVDKNQNTILGEQVDDTTRRGTISWNSTQVPDLAKLKPGAEVDFDIQLPVKDGKAFSTDLIKQPLITAVAETRFKDSSKANQTLSTKPIAITLNSDLTFSNDDTVSAVGDGGEKHSVSWVLNNTFHPLKNIQITADVFGSPTFTALSKGAGDLSYDGAQNKIIWTVPDMTEGTDVLNCSFVLTLPKRNPTQSLLLSKAHLTATDSVTGKTIDLAGEEISLGQ